MFGFYKLFDEGTESPFIKRLYANILRFRDVCLPQNKHNEFDKLYMNVFSPLYDCRRCVLETYSLLCNDNKTRTTKEKNTYYFLVSFFDHIYWVTGSVIGAIMGSFITFSTEGIEFALTALFVTVFVEQWLSTKNHMPALIGLISTTISLVLFGSEHFLIPSMIIITISLSLYKEEK